MPAALRDLFLLDSDIIFLNHGSFGACPRPVFETYQQWQLELEQQPVKFLGRRAPDLLDHAGATLAQVVGCDPADLILVTNATEAINAVARSLKLNPGDEILTTDHEYGAVERTWRFIAETTGARIVTHTLQLPLDSPDDLVDDFWQSVTPQTRVIAISHITSPTALLLPVDMICQRAREAGILTVIDGAHTPGQIPLDLTQIDADYYTGNCHKWLCTPKGAAFLYVRREHHERFVPPVISWGWPEGDTLVRRSQWQGTRDISAWLTIPAAIEFLKSHDWDSVRARCHTLADQTQQRITQLTGHPPLAKHDGWFGQMAAATLPNCDPIQLKTTLYDQYRVEVPVIVQGERILIRVSFQGYNTDNDADYLLKCLEELLSKIVVV